MDRSDDLFGNRPRYTEEERMDRAGSEKGALESAWGTMKASAEAIDAAKKGSTAAAMILKATGFNPEENVDESGAAGKGVAGMQKMLAGIGMAVRPTGNVDQATVNAINAVFSGWDDAPPKLRGGALTAKQISSNLPAVSKYLRIAIHGAQDFGDATRGW